MKNFKLYATLIFIVTLASCVRDNKQETQDVADSVSSDVSSTATETTTTHAELKELPWLAEVDTVSLNISLKRNNQVSTQNLDAKNVIQIINKKYPENQLVWKKKSNDTAYVNIPDAFYLTQSSGSLGARIFLAESTFSITEIPGIKVVYFDFEAGDHASPGAYQRADFK
jgi:reverse gyrase